MSSKSQFLTLAAIAGGGAMLYHFQGLADSAKNLTARITSLKPSQSGGTVSTVVNIEVLNTGRSDIRLDYLLGNIKLGDTVVGTITENSFAKLRATKPDFGVIKARDRQIIGFTVKTQIVNTLLSALFDALSAGIPKTVSMQGTLMAEGIRIPLNYSKQFIKDK